MKKKKLPTVILWFMIVSLTVSNILLWYILGCVIGSANIPSILGL